MTTPNAFVPSTNFALTTANRANFFSPAVGSLFANPNFDARFGYANPYAAWNADRFGRHFERDLWRAELASAYYNPYLDYGYGNFGYGNPYAGYGTGYYPTPAYGTGTAYAAANNPVAPPTDSSTSKDKKLPVLAAFGIPSEAGEVQWPSAFRLLPPDKRDLLKKLEAQLKIAATQAANGKATPIVLREAQSTIDELRDWLRERQPNMAENANQDADRFLRRLTESIHAMSP